VSNDKRFHSFKVRSSAGRQSICVRYVYDPDSKGGDGSPQSSLSSPEDLMKNLPKVMSNMYGAGGGMPGNSPTFKITMKEYEDMAIKVGDKVGIEVKKVDSSSGV
jgi:hypothetical protein